MATKIRDLSPDAQKGLAHLTFIAECYRNQYATEPEALEQALADLRNIWKSIVETDLKDGYCLRCEGKGIVHGFEHIENGICFRCRGDAKFHAAVHA